MCTCQVRRCPTKRAVSIVSSGHGEHSSITEKHSRQWSNKSKNTPVRVFEFFFLPSPLSFSFQGNLPRARIYLNLTDHFARHEQLKAVWHQNAVSILMALGSRPTETEDLSRPGVRTPACSHLTHPVLGTPCFPLSLPRLLLHPLTPAGLETEGCECGRH